MSAGFFILLAIFGGVIALGVIITKAFRFVTRKFGVKELIDEGILLTDNGIEYPRFPLMRRGRARYDEIEFVELVPFPKNLLYGLLNGVSVYSCPSAQWLGLFRENVVVKLKPPRFTQYYQFTPSDPVAVAKELKLRIQRSKASQRGM